jgi:hypothetical protein
MGKQATQRPVAEAAVALFIICTLWIVDNLAYALLERFAQ